ncbi:nucleoside triphosphate pyrophosphohydrolase like protein [Babesia gibsoni]|uniref:Bis(5'-nucleosyl)-tetraphosphatase [asymmetrical] n=1 Tax=Babesia gibsoni TaxID=33632 RepID=A0AAD8LJP9_BABGI|nr:nucleoside triphosphate pyrophosphohydrolase like protein [Babesia gibsoni]
METDDNMVRAAGIILYLLENASKEAKYLLLKASNKPYHWTPPKGRLDPGENYVETAYRETWEECGVPKDLIQMDDTYKEVLHYTAHGKAKECVYYLGKLMKPDAAIKLSHEHTEYAWVPVSKIGEYCDKESLRSMIMKADDHIKQQT